MAICHRPSASRRTISIWSYLASAARTVSRLCVIRDFPSLLHGADVLRLDTSFRDIGGLFRLSAFAAARL
jgi:hypothetical protein